MRLSLKKRRPLISLLAAVAVGGAAYLGWQYYRDVSGSPAPTLSDQWHQSKRVFDRNGTLLREIPAEGGDRGRSLALSELGDRIVLATLVSEDKDFYEHDGIDKPAVVRAALQNVRHGRVVSGASTITQQLVKLLDSQGKPRPRTLAAKFRESARAQNLEEEATKNQILEAYLNRLGYGHGLIGPEAAAQAYFGAAARDLSWAQAAFLAVLPRAPSYLDPYNHQDRVVLRQKRLLEALHGEGLMSDADFRRADAEPLKIKPLQHPMRAPHFVEALRKSGQLANDSEVRTTLDFELQKDIEGLIRTHLATIADRGVSNAAAIVIDNHSGDVLAYAGSADFWNNQIDGQIDMIRARRQPGSALKPFVYAIAFERGVTGSEMLADIPTSFSEKDLSTWAPSNFHGSFEGPISAREALAGSLNIPAIRLLADIGPKTLLDRLHALGMNSLDRDASHYGLALSLGSGEIQLSELAAAYMALARGGEAIPLRMRLNGQNIQQSDRVPPQGTQIFEPSVAALVSEILSDPLARIRGLHGQGPFDLGYPVAVKTGTSSGFRDAWTAGYTHEKTVVVWLGNTDAAPMREVMGSSGAGPLFADIMRRAMRDVNARKPLWDSQWLVETQVCPLSGKPRSSACPEEVSRRFARGHEPSGHCDIHVHASPRAHEPSETPFRCDEKGSSTIAVFPEAFDSWLSSLPMGAPGRDSFGIPWYSRRMIPGCAQEQGGLPEIRITKPENGSIFSISNDDFAERQGIEIAAQVSGGDEIALEFVVDGQVVGQSKAPYRIRVPARAGRHEIIARPKNPSYSAIMTPSRFTVR